MSDISSSQQHSNEIIRECPLCSCRNQNEMPSVFSRDSWKIKTCKKCSFLYLENVVPYSELVKNFAWTETSRLENEFRLRRSPFLKKISNTYSWFKDNILKRDKGAKLIKKLINSGKLLDVGCGSGVILKKLPKGIIPYGIEIESKTAKLTNEYALEKGGQVWHNDAVSSLNEIDKSFFDCIVMQSYLEHEINPKEVLNGAFHAIKKNGYIIIKVPNFSCWNRHLRKENWCGFRFPDHVNYFTPSTLKKLALDTGFKIHRFSLADRSPLSDNMWMVLVK